MPRFSGFTAAFLNVIAAFSAFHATAFSIRPNKGIFQRQVSFSSQLFATIEAPPELESANSDLSELFPDLAPSISNLGFVAPTPIQQSSAQRALDGESMLLVAATGSGKTLAYLLPALTKAMREDGTILVVAPTRELAVQLLRDAVALLGIEDEDEDDGVRLAVRGVEPPILDDGATVLIGTPLELEEALLHMDPGSSFINSLSAVVLDEVDVLLPPTLKTYRTALDVNGGRAKTSQDERRKKEQKRKVKAAKRRGVQLDDETNRVKYDTERILELVANSRLQNGPPQVLAGSATASRKTLDRLNLALRASSRGAAVPLSLNVKLCRPLESSASSEEDSTDAQHTIRTVTVPNEVKHCYVELSKEAASDPAQVLATVANAASELEPKTSLLFLCGEFGKPKTAEKAAPKRVIKGATNQARRNAKRKAAARGLFATAEKKAKQKQSTGGSSLSARQTCKILSELGITAQPLHVALGLESSAEDDGDDNDETPPFLVTFEGSARGLHFDGVDAVFVLGRPASAASYLHLAGRVGRSSADENGNVVVNPGTVVSICTKGSAAELDKWTKQIGGLELTEIQL